MKKVKEKIQKIIEQGMNAGASAVKVKADWGISNACHYKNAALKDIDFIDKSHIYITVIKDGRQGTGSVSSINDIDDGLNRALDMVKVGKQVYFTKYPIAESYPDIKLSSPDVNAITTNHLIKESSRFCNEMKEVNKDFNISCTSFKHSWKHIRAFSNGTLRETTSTAWWIQGHVQLSGEGDIYQIYDFRGSRKAGNDVHFGPVIDTIKANYENGRVIAKPVSGNLPVVFAPECVNALGWILTIGVNGKQVAEKASPLSDKLEKKIFADNITVLDNPHIDFDFQANDMDDDGIPTRKMTIVDKGILKAFAYDLNTASKCNTEPTGHSGCMLQASHILPGNQPWKELIKHIDKGIYVQSMIGFGQGNIINGDFSANIGNGFLIENGEITGRVKNTMIAGNLYDLAKQNVMISSDIHPQHKQPWLILDGVSVSSKA